MKKTAVTYARKSIKVHGQDKEKSVSYQHVKMAEYAVNHELMIVKQYSDVGYSGVTDVRPELQEMLLDLEREKVDYLLVYSVDRFGRDLNTNITLFLKIVDLVENIVFVTDNISYGSSELFKMFFLFQTAMSQKERDKLLNRFADARYSKVLTDKKYDGKYPLGFVKGKGTDKIFPATSEISADEDKQEQLLIVKYIYYCYLFKMSLRSIAKAVNEKFGPTRRGAKWSYKAIQYILKNEHYSGYLSGVLQKKYPYYMETDQIEKVIEPAFHRKILKMLEYEKPGRRAVNKVSPTLFCLCNQCGENLMDQGEQIACYSCDYIVNKKQLLKMLVSQTLRIIESDCLENEPIHMENLKRQYELRVNKLQRLEKTLKENKLTIEGSDQFEKLLKDTLVKKNADRLIEIRKERRGYESLIKWLLNTNREAIALDGEYIINLPYLIVFDHIKKETKVIFHSQVFERNEVS
ncbi:recombinase family protein [Alkalihalophilus pseudofirmus]|uniref:Recombinase family protein n=1 Tax=Alkalihalophilus pseudofirmus TaxID=79885 RepID=A0AAJ2U3B1_ALKPS|nr:recombinase family protein [Alkalihalophilus pseudofirmus]MDV2886377.1 recombinase family protein [Alkalihalophilus pseudofirmus]